MAELACRAIAYGVSVRPMLNKGVGVSDINAEKPALPFGMIGGWLAIKQDIQQLEALLVLETAIIGR